MKDKPRAKGLLARKLANPEYRKSHEERYAAFKLEAQILQTLEDKGWSYSDLAKATQTYKSNISRDLKAGGIFLATFSRISKIADALGMKLVTLLIPKENERFVLPEIEEIVRNSSSAAFLQFKLTEQSSQVTNLDDVFDHKTSVENSNFDIENSNVLIHYGQDTGWAT